MNKSFWSERPVLVTGCTGFLGSWLTLRLVDAGAHVVGLVRDRVPLSNFWRSHLEERITVVPGTITDYETVERTLNEYSIDTCFHLAAQAIVGTANRSPISTFESNIAGTWVVLEAIRNSATVGRVVVASSDKAYGDYPKEALPYREEYALRGRNPYDASKACADLIAQCYAHTLFRDGSGARLGLTRCANIVGGGDLNFGRIVPDTIWAVLHDCSPVLRSHGLHVRDFLYVLDATEAYFAVAERLEEDGVAGEAFNFALESPLTINSLVARIIHLAGKPGLTAEIRGNAPMPGEILAQHLCAQKARDRLAWQPRYDLDQALHDTLDWFRHWIRSQSDPSDDLFAFNVELVRRFEGCHVS